MAQWRKQGPESIRASTRAMPVERIENPYYTEIEVQTALYLMNTLT